MDGTLPGAPPRREVSLGGRMVGFGIIGMSVVVAIFIENGGAPERQAMILPLLGAGLALGVGLPVLLFRRPVVD